MSLGKLSEMARARYYQAHGVPLSAVSGALFVERILDLLTMILLAFAALPLPRLHLGDQKDGLRAATYVWFVPLGTRAI